MDYFNRFRKKGDDTSTGVTIEVPLLSTPVRAAASNDQLVSVATLKQTEEADPVTSQKETRSVANNAKKSVERDANGNILLWETKILKTVLPDKLVWAPLYRFRNQLFCARLCESDEINRDLYIKTPLQEGECVVEMICAPKTKAMDTKLLVVPTDKIIPYYGKGININEVDRAKWSELHLKKLRAVRNITKLSALSMIAKVTGVANIY